MGDELGHRLVVRLNFGCEFGHKRGRGRSAEVNGPVWPRVDLWVGSLAGRECERREEGVCERATQRAGGWSQRCEADFARLCDNQRLADARGVTSDLASSAMRKTTECAF